MKSKLTVVSFAILVLGLLTFPIALYAVSTGGDKAPLQQSDQPQDPKNIVTTDSTSEIQTPSHVETDSEAAIPADEPQANRAEVISKWLHMLDTNDNAETGDSSVLAFGSQVPGDLARTLGSIGSKKDSPGFFSVLLRALISICVGFFVVIAIKRIAKERIAQLEQLTPPDNSGRNSLWAGILRSFPAMVTLFLFAISSILVFLLIAGSVSIEGRMLFQAVIGTVLIIKACVIVGRIIFAPEDNKVRLIELPDTLVKPLYRVFSVSFAILLSGLVIVNLVRELGAQLQTISWVVIILGSAVISVFVYLVLYLRKPVAEALQARTNNDKESWLKEQLSTYWHLSALLYLLAVWFIWMGQEMTGTVVRNGSFIISMLIVPIYFVVSHAGNLLITAVIDSLGIGQIKKSDALPGNENEPSEELIARRNTIISKSQLVFRLLIIAALAVWVLSLWGYPIPFAAVAVRAIFESLVTLALALACWRFASSYIQRKIEEPTPEPTENEEDDDNEFGGAVPVGRSHTLLPMLRKVLGSILVVMVILTVLSSLGVNIAPLLAGAGVLGLAIGFGAQKLVSDVLSGFFFLLDDAFRVGEYIQAGSIKGSVESITLRNVMLRHHLGMLQIVPHSDLGAITNFMRGGVIIKFPLEFSYDTDIDKVRKIIKKVGQAMLKDEVMGDDFLQPIKSQGVNQISNSIMVIRVKFTSKPGKQFVIKREAFRRITEALNAKGIYYAHRKVIVDFPSEDPKGVDDEGTRIKMLQAGAASALAAEAEQSNNP